MKRNLSKGRADATAYRNRYQAEKKPTYYSGFASIQMESYYDRIASKMIEVLCEFVVSSLSKGMTRVLKEKISKDDS